MSRGQGLVLVIAAWLSNQIIGYAILGYPRTFESFAWGAAIGFAAVLAFIGARAAMAFAGRRSSGIAIAFLVAFGLYELALYLIGIPLRASADAFSATVMTRVFEINAISFVGLLVLHRLTVHVSPFPLLPKPAPGAG